MNTDLNSAAFHPRVTVLMALNRADQYLEQAICSILVQTFDDFEFLIIVDEGRNDLKEEVTRIVKGDKRVRVIEVPQIGGLAFALNKGIGESHGEYIARMDGDDISLPDRLKVQVSYLDENLAVDVLGCRARLIDANSKVAERRFPYFQTNADIRRVLPYRNPLLHPALMFRKDVLFSVGGYKYGHTSEDHEMFIRMARNPEVVFHNLDIELFEYRRHESQGTRPGRMRVSFVEISGFLFTEFLSTYSLKYIFGMFVVHPWVRKSRLFFRRLRYGNSH